MSRHFLVVVVPLLLLLGGCKRSVCGFADNGFDPMSAEWEKHKGLVPASAMVCGHFKKAPGVEADMSRVLQIDFEDDGNPWVTIVDHMEKQGFTRVSQNVANADSQTAVLRKDALTVNVSTFRAKGRVRAVLSLGK